MLRSTIFKRSYRALTLGIATLIGVLSLLTGAHVASAAVALGTGRYEYSWTDIGRSGVDSLIFKRSYMSTSSRVGPLGPGWTHSFNMRLSRVTNRQENDLMFVDSVGLQTVFAARPDGTYESPQYGTARLEKKVIPGLTDQYELTDDDGTVYRFHGGLPVQITYPNNEKVSLMYDVEGRLLSVTRQPDGKRMLKFSYSDDGKRLVSIAEGTSDPRHVMFDYDHLGRLANVTNRLGHVTRYTYAGETHHLHEIIDARGHVALAMEYDEGGRVHRQQNTRSLQEGKATTFQYERLDGDVLRSTVVYPPSTFAPTFSSPVVVTYDPRTRIVTERTETAPGDEPVVETRSPSPQGPGFSSSRSGGKTPEPAAGGTRLDEVTLAGLPATMTIRVGSPVPAVVDTTPRPERTATQLVEVLANRADERSTDRFGRVTGLVISAGGERLAGTWRVEYDDEDRIVSLTQGGTSEQTTSYRYDEVGNLVEIGAPDGSVRQYEYDDRDSLVGLQDASGAAWRFEYDERDRLSRTTTTPADGSPARTVEMRHDALGRLRLVRDLTDPAAPVETELQYDLTTLVGIWQRPNVGPSDEGQA